MLWCTTRILHRGPSGSGYVTMEPESSILEQAMTLVDQERSYLREERCAFQRFRERVRLTTPDSVEATGSSETTAQLFNAYREEVMEPLDHEIVYGDTLVESLEEELSPTIADLFVTKKPFTQRRKRDLLVKTTTAIESREKFCVELEEEWVDLKTYSEELADIEAALEKLPACSIREEHLEKFLIVWEVYDTLLEQCQRLLERRQQQIREAERSSKVFEEKHARNELLYSELETWYPVLSAIATTCERIESKRNDTRPIKLLD